MATANNVKQLQYQRFQRSFEEHRRKWCEEALKMGEQIEEFQELLAVNGFRRMLFFPNRTIAVEGEATWFSNLNVDFFVGYYLLFKRSLAHCKDRSQPFGFNQKEFNSTLERCGVGGLKTFRRRCREAPAGLLKYLQTNPFRLELGHNYPE